MEQESCPMPALHDLETADGLLKGSTFTYIYPNQRGYLARALHLRTVPTPTPDAIATGEDTERRARTRGPTG
jgi:hypothetical protein